MTGRNPQSQRLQALDFVKGAMILLVAWGHVEKMGATRDVMYGFWQPLVYTFHMPVFLFLSGYFTRVTGDLHADAKRMIPRVAVPYFVFQGTYVLALHLAQRVGFPITQDPGDPTIAGFLHNILLDPTGPLWYLHILLVYQIVVIFTAWLFRRNEPLQVIAALLLLFALTQSAMDLPIEHFMFLVVGTFWRRAELPVPRTLWAALLLALLLPLYGVEGLTANAAIFIVWVLAIFAVTHRLGSFAALPVRIISYVGRNTLIILTMHLYGIALFKFPAISRPLLAVDPSGILRLLLVTAAAAAFCILAARVIDLLHLAPLVAAKRRLYEPWLRPTPAPAASR